MPVLFKMHACQIEFIVAANFLRGRRFRGRTGQLAHDVILWPVSDQRAAIFAVNRQLKFVGHGIDLFDRCSERLARRQFQLANEHRQQVARQQHAHCAF